MKREKQEGLAKKHCWKGTDMQTREKATQPSEPHGIKLESQYNQSDD